MSHQLPKVLVTKSEEREQLTAKTTFRQDDIYDNISKDEKNTEVNVVGTNRGNHLTPAGIKHRHSSLRHASLETDSIGSAGSIMFDHRAPSSGSRVTGASLANSSIDLDDEILVGDEKDFHNACRSGDVALVEQLIKSGIDINCRNKHDRTPMHWAAGNGHLEILKILLDEGATIDAADKFGMDTLLWAAWFGHKACVQHMMHAGAKPKSRNKHGYTWLHCAAQNNHSDVIKILSEEMQDFDGDVVDDNGRSCLHISCKYGRTALAVQLLQFGCNVKLKDKAGNTPLHIAAKHGFAALVPVLVEADCDVNATNNNEQTPLHVAASEGNAEFCQELLQYEVDVNAETEDETCPIHLAVAGGHLRTTEVLIQHDADFDAGNKHNQTPLHFAVTGSHLAVTKLLVRAGSNASVPDARSETPLHLAAENGLYDITEVLLIAHSNHNIKDLKGKTPLDVAARGNYVTIVDMILKAERYRCYYLAQNPDLARNLLTNVSFKPDQTLGTQHLRTLLYRLASKHLKAIEWKQLAFFWGFTDRQLQAIEEQYTGSKSYKEHGHRMLLIWLHGCTLAKQNPIKGLYEGLVGIQRRDLAELMRTKATQTSDDKACLVS